MLIEIFADPICPWCYVGTHRLSRALERRPRRAISQRWLPFQLNPDMPSGGMERSLYLMVKFGGAERARQFHEVIEQAAAQDGLPLHLDRIRRTPSTFDAHRLVRFAGHDGRATDLMRALFRAYFVEGLDIGDREVLMALAAGVGLDPDAARRLLEGDAEASAIRSSDGQARQLGVQAVPCFIFNRRFALSGAQEPEAFLPLLDIAETEAAVA